jgi:hypothetical protein
MFYLWKMNSENMVGCFWSLVKMLCFLYLIVCLSMIVVSLRLHLTFRRLPMSGLLPQKFVRNTELSATTKLSSGDETPPIANVLLAVVILASVRLASSLLAE